MGRRRRFSAFVTKDSNCSPTVGHSLQFAREFLKNETFDPRLQVKLVILVEELVTNALRHGGAQQDLALLLSLEKKGDGIRLAIEDNGPAFDPFSVPPATGPDPKTGGGIGLAIVQAWGEDAAYERKKQGNSLTLILR